MQNRLSRSTVSSRTKNTIVERGKGIATAKRRFNRRRYATLLAKAAPQVITDSNELERISRSVEPLLKKGETRSPEETALCELLLRLIDDYQERHSIVPELAPNEMLQALIEESGRRRADLVPIFGSRSRVSDAVNGKRAISKTQAKRLGEFFRVSPAAFI